MQQWGAALLGLGLILFGLFTIEAATEPLHKYPPFERLLSHLDDPLLGALAGALVTALIQSSSATVGIVIVLAGQGLLTPAAGVAVMLGAEIGTCANVLIATAGRGRGGGAGGPVPAAVQRRRGEHRRVVHRTAGAAVGVG